MSISPHTPPGTKVACIDAKGTGPLLTLGAVYTLAFIEYEGRNIWAHLEEHPDPEKGFFLQRFRRLTDISDLQKLLQVSPVPRERETVP